MEMLQQLNTAKKLYEKGDRIGTLLSSGKELTVKEEQEVMEYYTAVDTELETQRKTGTAQMDKMEETAIEIWLYDKT